VGWTGDVPWRARYEGERDALVTQRIGWCAGLVFLCGVAIAVTVPFIRAEGWRADVWCAARLIAVSAPVLAWTILAPVHRAATAVGIVYLLALTATVTTMARQVPGLDALVPALLLAVMFGSTIMLPWGARRQAVVAAGAVVAFVLAASVGMIAPLVPSAYLVASAAFVSIVGSHLVEQYRETGYERSWVQEQLVVSARALARHVEMSELAATIVMQAERLVPGHSVVLAIRDKKRGVMRVLADSAGSPATRDLEVPEALEPVQRLLAAPLVCLPDDDPTHPVVPLLEQNGVRRVLYATLRHADERIGLLSFVRRTAAPFSDAELLIVRGLVEQVALALATARVVSDLRAADRLKTEFVSTMSHELRTPLNVILGFSEMLVDDQLDPNARASMVSRIQAAGRDLLELIENTLAIGRLEAGRDELRLATVPLGPLWEELGGRCLRMPRRPDVVLAWRDAPAVAVRTDPHKLQVVVANLVSNALKFTERGEVVVALEVDGDDLVARVVDTGIGIAVEDQAHVFDMFRQVDSSDRRRYGGTGLGLYIVRRFVEQLGGEVGLESAVGHGSTFTVRLPGAQARSAKAA
jgi:signal transduction histidine kinase